MLDEKNSQITVEPDSPELETPVTDAETESPQEQPTFDSLPPITQKEIKSLRAENKRHRLALEEKKRQEEERQQAAQIEAGNYKEVIDKLSPKAAAYNSYVESVTERNEARIAAIPAIYREMVESVAERFEPLEFATWLDRNEVSFKRPTPPNLDAGVTGDTRKKAIPAKDALTGDELFVARAMNMTPEQYLESKNRDSE